MAFVAVLPAVGSAVLPALGTVAGTIGSGLGSLGSMAATGLGSLGSMAGSTLGSLGSAIGGGVKALGSGLGGLYGGADALLGGILPNMGIAGTVAPSAGWLGSGGLGLIGPGAGATGYGTVLAPPAGGFPAAGGGLLGGLKTVGEVGGVLNMMRGGGAPVAPGVTATGINARPVNQEKEDIKQNGGQVGATSSINLAPSASYSPMAPGAGGGPLQYNNALALGTGLGTGGLLDLIQNMQDPQETNRAMSRSLGAVYGSRPTTMV